MRALVFNLASRYRSAMSEKGVALVAAIYVLLVLSILGSSILVVTSNQGTGVASARKSNQSLAVAESGAEYAVWLVRTLPTSGGKGTTWTNAAYGSTINQALASGAFETKNITDASGSQIGIAKLIVQRKTAASITERRITSVGQACLNLACTKLAPQRIVQEIIDIAGAPGPFYNYALFYNSTSNNAALDLDNIWMSGGAYAGHGQNVILKTIEANGNIYSHSSVQLAACAGDEKTIMGGTSKIYTFGTVENSAGCLDPVEAAMETYNGGVHNDTFPEVTTQTWNNRAWYRGNAAIHYPSDAATNLNASADRHFCSDSDGYIHYEDSLSDVCSSADPRVNNSDGTPFQFGMIFVAGDVAVHGTFSGQLTFIAGGSSEPSCEQDATQPGPEPGCFPGSGADLYIGNNNAVNQAGQYDDLRSLRTVSGVSEDAGGLEPGGCQTGLDPDPDGVDSIGLVAGEVKFDVNDAPCYVRAIFWAKNDVGFEEQASKPYPPLLEIHATILEVGNQLTIRGEHRNLHLYYDSGLIDSLPPGVQNNGVTITVLRKSYQEVFSR